MSDLQIGLLILGIIGRRGGHRVQPVAGSALPAARRAGLRAADQGDALMDSAAQRATPESGSSRSCSPARRRTRAARPSGGSHGHTPRPAWSPRGRPRPNHRAQRSPGAAGAARWPRFSARQAHAGRTGETGAGATLPLNRRRQPRLHCEDKRLPIPSPTPPRSAPASRCRPPRSSRCCTRWVPWLHACGSRAVRRQQRLGGDGPRSVRIRSPCTRARCSSSTAVAWSAPQDLVTFQSAVARCAAALSAERRDSRKPRRSCSAPASWTPSAPKSTSWSASTSWRGAASRSPARGLRGLAEAAGFRLGSQGAFVYPDARGNGARFTLENQEQPRFRSEALRGLSTPGGHAAAGRAASRPTALRRSTRWWHRPQPRRVARRDAGGRQPRPVTAQVWNRSAISCARSTPAMEAPASPPGGPLALRLFS